MEDLAITSREQAAFNAGVEAVRQVALVAAITIETRDNAREVRHQAAVAALQGLADGARELLQGGQPEAAAGLAPAVSADPVSSREAAEAQGFTGDACTTCGAFAMKRAGTYLTCQNCGTATGCG